MFEIEMSDADEYDVMVLGLEAFDAERFAPRNSMCESKTDASGVKTIDVQVFDAERLE